MPWEMSTSCASGLMPRITPFMIPTYGSEEPKSVVSVTMPRDTFASFARVSLRQYPSDPCLVKGSGTFVPARPAGERHFFGGSFVLDCEVAGSRGGRKKMSRFARVILIVLDSVGIGEMPDAAEYGDEGSDTLGNINRTRPCCLPHLVRLGLAN